MKKDNLNELSAYSFTVPEELIAQNPQDKRDQSRLLKRSKEGELLHTEFQKLPDLLPEGSLIIVNETKVFSCRLLTKTPTGGKLEIFLLENPVAKGSSTLTALVRPSKKAKVGMELVFDEKVIGKIVSKDEEAQTKTIEISFNLDPEELSSWIDKKGSIPLPPYIKRKDRSQHEEDLERYQTVYAKNVGSVAAPTAGLHFTPDVIAKLKEKNIEIKAVTLHVGLGTFLPIKEEIITNHKMHEETYRVPKETLLKIQEKKKEGKKIILVGTTSLRCLESFLLKSQKEKIQAEELTDKWIKTSLFIHPKEGEETYTAQIGDGLITNFHQPNSSLFILISALIGRKEALCLYKEAVKERYRFFSYGDSNLLWFKESNLQKLLLRRQIY